MLNRLVLHVIKEKNENFTVSDFSKTLLNFNAIIIKIMINFLLKSKFLLNLNILS